MFAFVYILELAATVAAIAVPVDPVLGITLTSTPKTTKAVTTTTATTTTTASPSATAVIPDPSEVTINSISYRGTGCPQGSVGTFISDDWETFTIIFDSYVASIGPGIAITNNRLNCQLNIDLQYPSGFQFVVGVQ